MIQGQGHKALVSVRGLLVKQVLVNLGDYKSRSAVESRQIDLFFLDFWNRKKFFQH